MHTRTPTGAESKIYDDVMTTIRQSDLPLQ